MTEMTGITTMTTVYRDWDDQDEQVDWDQPMCIHTREGTERERDHK